MNNIHYNKFAFDFQGKTIRQKEEEQKKGNEEELKTEEKRGSSVVPPKAAAVTANADELVENYIKGAMMLPKGGVGNVEEPKGVQEDGWEEQVEHLIAYWEGLDDGSYEEKINVLTQIIELYENNGGEEGVASARIWRVRRDTVVMNERKSNYLGYLQRLNGGEPFDQSTWQNIKNQPASFVGDGNAIYNFTHNYITLSDDEKLAYDTYYIACYAQSTCFSMVDLYRSNPPAGVKDWIHEESEWTFNYINRFVVNPLNENENWQDTYAQYRTKFTEFQQIMEDPNHPVRRLKAKNEYTGELITAVQGKVNELTNLIGELRELGFPYCDELLIAIQGYLVYAGGYDDIDVLPYPVGGEGGAKPDTIQKMKSPDMVK